MDTESMRQTRTMAGRVQLFTDCTMIFMRLPARPRMSRVCRGSSCMCSMKSWFSVQTRRQDVLAHMASDFVVEKEVEGVVGNAVGVIDGGNEAEQIAGAEVDEGNDVRPWPKER